ncbi:MAG: hypothetical protein AAGB93_10245 [Planctomycetota bacterium]
MAPKATIPSLLLLAAASPAAAQNDPVWTAPGFSRSGPALELDFATNPVLMPLSPHPRPIYACNVHKTPSDPPGQVTLCFTVRALQGFGNPGFSGMLIAKWTPGAATPLVLTNEADATNDSFVDYNLNLEPTIPDGMGGLTGARYCVFDRFALDNGALVHQGAFLAARADDLQPFGAPVAIANLQATNGFSDPNLGYVDGQLKIFYAGRATNAAGVEVGGILMDDLIGPDSGAPMAAGNPVLVSQPVTPSTPTVEWYCHSPSVLSSRDGNVEALFVAEGDGGDRSDIYFTADLDPETDQVLSIQTSSWLHAGGTAGGMSLFAYRAGETFPWIAEGTWMVGDTVSPGDVAEVTMGAWNDPGTPPAFSIVYAGTPWLDGPATWPGYNGTLGIAPLVTLGGRRVADGNQMVSHRMIVPPIPSLVGLDVPIQGLSRSIDASGAAVFNLSNTAVVRIR